jgi:hypothetical protein
LDVGFGVRLGGLGRELGVGLGVGVEAGVVLDALGVAEDALSGGGCTVVILTKQGGVGWCVEEFEVGAELAHEAGESNDGAWVRVLGGVVGLPGVGGLGEVGGGGVDEDLEHGDVVGGVDAHGVGMGLGFDDGEGVSDDGVVFGELIGAGGRGSLKCEG